MPPKKLRGSAAASSQGTSSGGVHTGITAEVRAWRRNGITEQDIRRQLKDKGLKKSNISQIMKKTAPEGTWTCTVWSGSYQKVNPNYYCMF
jgi:effector-binding domain-containing protein